MLTMQKEKVNTHFSFPMKLDMSAFVEKTLMPQQYNKNKKNKRDKMSRDKETEPIHKVDAEGADKNATESKSEQTQENSKPDGEEDDNEFAEYYEYKLIGVTVHTGTADGGHYYSFIKERSNPNSNQQQDRWFLFNDAEVKQFDPSQIEAECFGGEMTSKTYDSVTEKYLDFSFEKTNSAYMLFYERCSDTKEEDQPATTAASEPKVAGDVYEQMPSCSSATTDSKPTVPTTPSSPIKQVVVTSSQEAGSELDENKNSVAPTLGTASAKPIPSTNDQHETESNSDLVIVQNKCDIDNKSENNCNVTGKAAAISVDSKPLKSASDDNVLSKELEEWIWEDNRYFLQDRNIFEHTYFK